MRLHSFTVKTRKKLGRMTLGGMGESWLAPGNAGAVIAVFFISSQSGGAAWLLRRPLYSNCAPAEGYFPQRAEVKVVVSQVPKAGPGAPGYAPELNPDELVWSHMKRT